MAERFQSRLALIFRLLNTPGGHIVLGMLLILHATGLVLLGYQEIGMFVLGEALGATIALIRPGGGRAGRAGPADHDLPEVRPRSSTSVTQRFRNR